jgi:hypothetical protein
MRISKWTTTVREQSSDIQPRSKTVTNEPSDMKVLQMGIESILKKFDGVTTDNVDQATKPVGRRKNIHVSQRTKAS